MFNRLLASILIIVSIISCTKETTSDVNSETSNWMSNLIKANPEKNIALIDIAIPSSHDAAIYLLQDCVGGNECNTQTQYLNMKDQLEAGLRMFDIRPILHKGKFYTQHATSCDGFGCKGDIMDNILTQTRNFIDTHEELVFLQFSHFCGIEADDPDFLTFVNNKLGDRIYKETTPSAIPFIKRPIRDLIQSGSKKGKVVLVFDGIANTSQNRAIGLFTSNILPTAGGWTDDNNFPELKRNQLDNFSGFVNDSTRLFQFSWQVTQDANLAVECVLSPGTATSIRKGAQIANVQLPIIVDSLISSNDIRKGRIPNVIYVDFADAFVTNICIKLSKLNLQ